MTKVLEDNLSMPPPRKILRRGSVELSNEVKSGKATLSLPQSEARAWLEGQSEQNSTHKSSPTSNPPIRSQNMVATINHEQNWNKREDTNSDTASKRVYAYQGNASDDPMRDSVSASSSKSGAEQPTYSDTNGPKLSDVVGHGPVKLRIKEALLPILLPKQLADSILTGIRSFSPSILMHGPPGCGKTKLAKAIAGEAQAAFLSVSPSDVFSKFVGESEAAIRNVFDQAYDMANEMDSLCTVLFFDEIDALGQSRGASGVSSAQQSHGNDGCSRRVLAELLLQLNRLSSFDGERPGSVGQSENQEQYNEDNESYVDESFDCVKEQARIIVVAATNRPQDCDSALIRRFGVRVLVDLPSLKDRKTLLIRHLEGIFHTITEEQLTSLARRTEGWTGSDLEGLSREAAMAPVRECIRSAALLRKRFLKQQRTKLPPELINANPDEEARYHMIDQFQNLRAVSATDFSNAITFCYPRHGRKGKGRVSRIDVNGRVRLEHYDSSSDEDD